MLNPHQYSQLSPDSQRVFINSLTPQETRDFAIALQKYIAQAKRDADMLSIFPQTSTVSNVRFNLQMLKRSKDDTLVDVIARYPQLKQCAAVMELVREDFVKCLRPQRRHV